MPRFTLHDAAGTAYRLDATDLGLVHTWLYHWCPRLAPHGPLTLSVRPVRDPAGIPDWPARPESYWVRLAVAADPEVVMEQISKRREELESLAQVPVLPLLRLVRPVTAQDPASRGRATHRAGPSRRTG